MRSCLANDKKFYLFFSSLFYLIENERRGENETTKEFDYFDSPTT